MLPRSLTNHVQLETTLSLIVFWKLDLPADFSSPARFTKAYKVVSLKSSMSFLQCVWNKIFDVLQLPTFEGWHLFCAATTTSGGKFGYLYSIQ